MQYRARVLVPLAFAAWAAGAVTIEGHVDPATRRGLAERPNSIYLTRALVATATGHTLFDVGGMSDPTVSKVYSQLSQIERNCDATLRGTTSVPDRIGSAAIETNPRDELNLVDALTQITAHSCSRYSLDSMLTAYVLERKAGAQHAKVIAQLAADPQALLTKWRGKRYENLPAVTLDGTRERLGAPRVRDFR